MKNLGSAKNSIYRDEDYKRFENLELGRFFVLESLSFTEFSGEDW